MSTKRCILIFVSTITTPAAEEPSSSSAASYAAAADSVTTVSHGHGNAREDEQLICPILEIIGQLQPLALWYGRSLATCKGRREEKA